jgi:ribonuclease BN (tRNA processing enzyme)
MKLTVLGCSAGIAREKRTTCLLLDDDVLIDAGTGAGELTLDELLRIDHIFLTHSHLDHIALLPMIADARVGRRDDSLQVHALPETLKTLRECVFNFRLWPDYCAQPSRENPYVRLNEIQVGHTVSIAGRSITALPVRHAVPAVGYCVDSGQASFAFSGDTTLSSDFFSALNKVENLRYLMIETTFLNANAESAERSRHMTAELLARGLALLLRPPSVYITHLEPGREDATMQEVMDAAGRFAPQRMQHGQQFEF